MDATIPAIDERSRTPAPCAGSTGIAYAGDRLWLGSVETDCVYAFDPRNGTILEQWAAPGTPYGLAAFGDELRVVVGDTAHDDRAIARVVMGHGFEGTPVPCPDATGSWLACDGDTVFVCQRFAKRILALDRGSNVTRTIPVRREVTGMTMLAGVFYLMTTHSKDVDDYRLVRLDARGADPSETELARVDFIARGLAYDGTQFWTNVRGEDTLVAFARPDCAER